MNWQRCSNVLLNSGALEFERKQAEMALQENYRYTEAIIETVREALLVLDADLKVLSVN